MWFRGGLLLSLLAVSLSAQPAAYSTFPAADPPWYRVRYPASDRPGELAFGANYTIWIPPGVGRLRGVIVHQHGCGEGSCRSGLTGAFDLHWQALARKHACALLSPTYEQPEKADCQLWCDPRNGSDARFQQALGDLGGRSGHPELARVPWALWGHSGGGHWVGGMTLLHPDRVVAAWLRSGNPLLQPNPTRPDIRTHTLPDAALDVPLMLNLGAREGFLDSAGPFAGVWPANEAFFDAVRAAGGRIGIAVDPLTSHECGNQRYLAIPWLDACLEDRLPRRPGRPLRTPTDARAWLAPKPQPGRPTAPAVAAGRHPGDPGTAVWLPNATVARAWMAYSTDTAVPDGTRPPRPTHLRLDGNVLTWTTEADPESGIAFFRIERDGIPITTVPETPKNPFGRPLFQGLQYSDTPPQPLARMRYADPTAAPGSRHTYRVIAVNTVGLASRPAQVRGRVSR